MYRFIAENEWTQWSVRKIDMVAVSDASDDTAAFLTIDPGSNTVTSGAQWAMDPNMHIFFKELIAASVALQTCSLRKASGVLLLTDNTAVMHCINKGHSTSPLANRILQEIFLTGLQIEAHYIPTDKNPTDQFTRGYRIPETPFPVSQLNTIRLDPALNFDLALWMTNILAVSHVPQQERVETQ